MDYEGLKTLESVIRNQNFERAAKELFITQSAVSQRLNQLEQDFGKRLLVRELPYKATEEGEKILAHYRRVLSLEEALEVREKNPLTRPTIRISMNVDTLELWFRKVLLDKELATLMNLEVTTDDEKYTLGYLKSGRVDLSIGTLKSPVANHECVKLGSMTYVLVANPEFKKMHFRKGMNLGQIPVIVFNERDDLQAEFIRNHYNYSGAYPKSSIPAISGFKAALISGFGYGVQPLMDIEKELKAKSLVLIDNKTFKRDLYLHHWSYQTPLMKKLVQKIEAAAEALI